MAAALKIEDAIQWTPVRSWKDEPADSELLYTPQEYLRREADAEIRHEYIAGRIYAMAGGSPTHTILTADVAFALASHLRGSSCDALTSEAKVRVSNTGPFFYPDASVVCGEPDWDEEDCLRNPIVVVEVLSKSSANFDRGDKFVYYKLIESLRHYVLIDQEKIYVEHRARQADGSWLLQGTLTDPDGALSFLDLCIAIPIREIYRRVLPEPTSVALSESPS